MHLNCHVVHPHVTTTHEKIQFNGSRSAAYTFCVIDHQHCSRNLVFTWEDSLQPHHIWRICYIFWAGGGGEGALNDIWSLCGASLFKLRNQRPPMCYTSNVVMRGGGGRGGSADFGADTHLKSWSTPTQSMLADGKEHSTTLWSSPALATHCASTNNVYHSALLLMATFLFFLHFLLTPFPFGRQD